MHVALPTNRVSHRHPHMRTISRSETRPYATPNHLVLSHLMTKERSPNSLLNGLFQICIYLYIQALPCWSCPSGEPIGPALSRIGHGSARDVLRAQFLWCGPIKRQKGSNMPRVGCLYRRITWVQRENSSPPTKALHARWGGKKTQVGAIDRISHARVTP